MIKSNIFRLGKPALLLALALGSVQAGATTQLIQNGGFEADAAETYSPTSWSVVEDGQLGGVLATGASVSSATGWAINGPANGSYFGLVEATSISRNALIQAFVAPQLSNATLSFSLFMASPQASIAVDPAGLDYTVDGDNQHVRVDLLSASAGSFDTGANVVASFDVSSASSAWGSYSFDVTNLLAAGGSYQLRFANVANRGQLQLGVDDVSLQVMAVPEPESYALMLAGLGVIGAIARRRKQS